MILFHKNNIITPTKKKNETYKKIKNLLLYVK